MFWFNSNTLYINVNNENYYHLLKYYSSVSGELRHFNSDHVSSVLKTNKYRFLGFKSSTKDLPLSEYDKQIAKLEAQIMYIAFVDGEAWEINEATYNKLLDIDNKKELC